MLARSLTERLRGIGRRRQTRQELESDVLAEKLNLVRENDAPKRSRDRNEAADCGDGPVVGD